MILISPPHLLFHSLQPVPEGTGKGWGSVSRTIHHRTNTPLSNSCMHRFCCTGNFYIGRVHVMGVAFCAHRNCRWVRPIDPPFLIWIRSVPEQGVHATIIVFMCGGTCVKTCTYVWWDINHSMSLTLLLYRSWLCILMHVQKYILDTSSKHYITLHCCIPCLYSYWARYNMFISMPNGGHAT